MGGNNRVRQDEYGVVGFVTGIERVGDCRNFPGDCARSGNSPAVEIYLNIGGSYYYFSGFAFDILHCGWN